ncbi:HEPN domain-containing protein [Leptospira licerasiae]|uniref:HEPN domain-containing protein n=1 Tax=Leptospira licerasiae TaxID=447106 RepID=UPI0010844AD1|nr:HEPN domain-containing protein [Leptospira licerasiae]TGM88724.1 hypothetical protein EHR05_10960 [Leptospira licerasiae]
MKLHNIDQALENCRSHLASAQAANTPVESYLTRYLIVYICACFEEEIENIVLQRVRVSNDAKVSGFAESCLSQIFRSIKTSEISGLLNRFDVKCKDSFQSNVSGTRQETFYNNIVTNRHEVAHTKSLNINFSDLVMYYEEAHKILDQIAIALNA